MKKAVSVVAFDCDGVMFDTVQANHAFYNTILSHFDKPGLTPEQFSYVQMHTVEEGIAFLFRSESEQKAAHEFRLDMGYGPFIGKMEMEPDLKALLQRLRPEYHTAVATNRTDTMDRVLAEFQLTRFFDLVVCAHDVPNPKPHPDPLLHVLNHFSIPPQSMLYIGDSPLDEQAAASAGVHFAAYGNTSLDARFHISRLGEIPEILLSLEKG